MSALLSFDDVTLTIRERTIVKGVSFALNAGERLALIGPNGAGKTTLLRAALGLAPAAKGVIRLGADDPVALSPAVRARRAGYLPQRAEAAWPVRVDALVALGRFAYGGPLGRLGVEDTAAVTRALEAADVARFADRALDTLSGGEQARAHLARALAQAAPLLMLDEPTANLDPAQAARVAAVIETQNAAIFATHDFATALRCATRALVIAEGRVIADAAPRDALTPEILQRAFGRRAIVSETEAGPCVVFS